MRVKNIIFDMGGVLLDLDYQRCLSEFKRLGFKDIEKLISSYTQSGIFAELETGKISPEEFFERSRRLCACPDDVSDDSIMQAWQSFLVGIPPEKLRQISELRKDYRTYLLSNTNALHYPEIEKKYKLSTYFDKCYLSHEIGLAKPSPDIFNYVVRDAGIKPSETLFIDDSQANVQAALALGFNVYMAAEKEDLSRLFITLQPL